MSESSDVLAERIQGVKDSIAALDKSIDQRFQDAREQVAIQLTGVTLAISKSEAAQQRKNEDTNEFRDQLKDQAGTFITRREAEAIMQAQQERINKLELAQTAQSSKNQGVSASWSVLAGVIVVLGVLVTMWMNLKK